MLIYGSYLGVRERTTARSYSVMIIHTVHSGMRVLYTLNTFVWIVSIREPLNHVTHGSLSLPLNLYCMCVWIHLKIMSSDNNN